MTCQASACNQPTTAAVTVEGTPRNLCELHATAALVWIITSAPDTDDRPHTQRGCALPGCHHPRAIGRAICTHHTGEDTAP